MFYSIHIMHINNHKSDYHINIVYCGGSCVSYYRAYNQTLKLFMSEYSDNHILVSSSYWTDHNDVIKYQESTYYCMISNGLFISIPKPLNVDTDYGDECVVVKHTENMNHIY